MCRIADFEALAPGRASACAMARDRPAGAFDRRDDGLDELADAVAVDGGKIFATPRDEVLPVVVFVAGARGVDPLDHHMTAGAKDLHHVLRRRNGVVVGQAPGEGVLFDGLGVVGTPVDQQAVGRALPAADRGGAKTSP
jgi:hypothetical protein